MKHGIWQREQAYRRRLYVIAPIAGVLMTLLFLTSDRIPYREIEKRVGWEGEMRLMPEITIIADNQEETSTQRQHRLSAMTSFDLTLAEGNDIAVAPEPVKAEDEEQVEVALDEYDVRTVQAAREASYSEDYVILRMIEPVYPKAELELGIEGNVTVELFINEDGVVETATVLSALGPESFQAASLDAVRQFVFQPPVRAGKPASMWIKFRIKFRIFG